MQMSQATGRSGAARRLGQVNVCLPRSARASVAIGGKGEGLAIRRPGQVFLHARGAAPGSQPVRVCRVRCGRDLNLAATVRLKRPGNHLAIGGERSLLDGVGLFQFVEHAGNARVCFCRGWRCTGGLGPPDTGKGKAYCKAQGSKAAGGGHKAVHLAGMLAHSALRPPAPAPLIRRHN